MQPILPSRSRTFSPTRLAVGGGLFLLVVLLTTQLGGTGSAPPDETNGLASAPSPAEMLTVLVVVIGLLGGTLFFLPRLLRRTRLVPGKERVLELVDALPLGPKRQVYVVSYRDRTLVLGGGAEELNLIAEYQEDEFPETEAADATTPATAEELAVEPQAEEAPVHAGPEERPSREATPSPRRATRPLPSSDGVSISLSPSARNLLEEAPATDDERSRRTARPAAPRRRGKLPAAFQRMVDESVVNGETGR